MEVSILDAVLFLLVVPLAVGIVAAWMRILNLKDMLNESKADFKEVASGLETIRDVINLMEKANLEFKVRIRVLITELEKKINKHINNNNHK